ncbi:MAG: hypothetical protein COY98_01480 [Candidatus Yonathbacteria bacterium CG_4_10_14_0_8_um_filter_43_17]|uniref:Uncharacterized protein n=1 Tax=Candidatus Yonathbacteria bacterium CG_4_10_14_0_8_um_filter_43_17 TaxID=1975099 RepID=A0A2M7Q571_9BACT|nr:MAG: hypothetical protein COY98_01480 [Candidatus Yonathbacteria bacterium CG_4_10_14_0_8_um_filter_43_17]
MISKWSNLKPEAIRLRKQGRSLPYVHMKLGVPKSTLSYWFKDVVLTPSQYKKLHQDWKEALVKARKVAVKWHNNEKLRRLQLAEQEGLTLLKNIDTSNVHTTELALALLYLGEGTKAKDETGMGSSDPLILKFFITCLRQIYQITESKIKCELHLRADQDPEEMLVFWSKELKVSKSNFTKPYLDKRTEGSKTYDYYKGVCLVRCGTVAIQRKLGYVAKHFCNEVSARVQ